MSISLDSVQRPGSGLRRSIGGASVLRKLKCVESGGSSLCFMGWAFFGQVSERVERKEAAVTAERSPATVLRELLGGRCLVSLVDRVGEQTCVDGVLSCFGKRTPTFT